MARQPEKSNRNTSKSKTDAQTEKPRAENAGQSGAAELLKAQHQELQSALAKRSDANADRSEIVKGFAALWLPHQAVEEEILAPALRDSGFDEAKIIASEIRKDMINILLADLLQDEDEESAEPRLEALARELNALVEAHQADDESIKAAVKSAEGESPSLSSELKDRYERMKQRFEDIDENFGEAMGLLAPRRLSVPSTRRRSHGGGSMARYGGMRDRDEQGRFLPEDDRERSGERSSSQRGYEGGSRESRGRYEGERSYGERWARRGREYDEDERYSRRGEGRGRSGWYGDPEGHSEASQRGWQGRGREYDEDERYSRRGGGEGRGHGGWYGDPEGHSEASRRGWQRSGHGESGGYADSEGRSRAAQRGWDESRGGEGSSGARSRSRNEDDDRGYQSRRGRSDYDDDRGSSRSGGGRYGSERH